MFRKKKSFSVTELTRETKSPRHLTNCTTEDNSDTRPDDTLPPVKNYPLQAFVFMLFTSLFFTLASVLGKKLSYVSTGQLSLVLSIGMFVGSLPLAIYITKEIIGPKKDRPMLLFRGILGGTSMYFFFTTFKYLPLAEAAIVMSTAPAVTSLMALFYLKEPFGLMQVNSLVFMVVGVLLSVRLPELLSSRESTHFDQTYVLGLTSGVSYVLFISGAVVCQRKTKHIHFSVHILYFGFVSLVENGFINAVTSTYEYVRCGWDQIFMIAIGVLGFLGQSTFSLAIEKEAAGIVAVLRASLDIIIAMTFQILFFEEKLDVYNVCGASLVILSVSMQEIKNWLHTQPADSKIRQKLKLCLL